MELWGRSRSKHRSRQKPALRRRKQKTPLSSGHTPFFLTRGGCVLPGLGIGVVCGCGRGRRVSLAIMSWQTWGCAVVGARKLVPRKWPIRLGWILKSGESSSQSPPLQVLVVQSQGLGRGKTRTEKQDPPEKKWLKMLTSEQLVVVIRKF